MYRQLGFTLDRETKAGYWYIHPKEEKLMHRYNFTKGRLIEKGYDPNLSEKEITKGVIGLLKIWDCGQRVWTLSKL